MNTDSFLSRLHRTFSDRALYQPSNFLARRLVRHVLDPCRAVRGMTALKNQRLLHLGVSCLPQGEAYLEVGTYQGKTLISAIRHNSPRPAYACDNFSEFAGPGASEIVKNNLRRFGLSDRVRFFNDDFRNALQRGNISDPVGLYLYDGAHDEQSQYDGIRLAEPLLADEAVVLVDDWRYAGDSESYAKAGTLRAIAESLYQWNLLLELPARHNGDLAMWWNGLGVLSFRRRRL